MALLKARSRPTPADDGARDARWASGPSASADTGRGVRATWRYTVSSIVFYSLVIAISTTLLMLAGGRDGLQVLDVAILVLGLVALAALVRYCWFFRPGLGAGLPPRAYTLWLVLPAAALYLLGVLQAHTLWVAALPLWFAANALAVVVHRAVRLRILAAGLAALALHGFLGALLGRTPGGPLWEAGGMTSLVIYALMTPLLFVAGIWWWDIVVRLDDSRRASGELAVAQERLRFAADLHDIQGHHLQVIALKTELAGRLLESDPAAAAEQITEAQRLARTALEDTRALVHGYRTVSLASEAANAAEVLRAAGIESVVAVHAEGLPPSERTLLGLVIRESTTNILRHSEATFAEFVLVRSAGRCELMVRNDGVTRAPARSGGSGIDGLRRRFGEVGGSIHAVHEGGRFTLTASVPDPVGAGSAAQVSVARGDDVPPIRQPAPGAQGGPA